MMKKILLTLLLFAGSALILSAIPAKPGRFRYTQPDGSVITIMRHGDEWGHWTTDGQGRVVVQDADGYYRPVSEAQAQTIRFRAAARRREARKRQVSRTEEHIALGQKRFLVVLVQFPDRAFTTADAQAAFSDMLNKEGYSANGATGSARDFYFQNSHEVFEPIFDVYGPVTVENNMAYYGSNDEYGSDLHPEEAVYEACILLDAQIDFSKYDNDGDGTVDLVFMYYAGYGEADGGPEDSIWPHQWSLPDGGLTLQLDGEKVEKYACSNELQGSGPLKDTMVGIGTACHEFGHAMGLPDFYDTDYETNGLSASLFSFSTMDGGSYNNEGRTPPYFNIEERILLGWVSEADAFDEISASGQYTLTSVQNDKAYMIPTDQEGEYFILECRDDSGWDQYLPANGMIVYHADKSSRKVSIANYGSVSASELWSEWNATNAINENGSHPCFYVVPAADQENLMFGYEYVEGYGYYFDPYEVGYAQQIPFPGSDNVTSYTPVSWNDVPSSVSLSAIAYANKQVSFTASIPTAGLDYYSIKNPGNGVYQQGGSFALQLNEVENLPYSAVKWYFDDAEVTGTSVTLSSAGMHAVEAVVTLTGGKTQTVTLEIQVQ